MAYWFYCYRCCAWYVTEAAQVAGQSYNARCPHGHSGEFRFTGPVDAIERAEYDLQFSIDPHKRR